MTLEIWIVCLAVYHSFIKPYLYKYCIVSFSCVFGGGKIFGFGLVTFHAFVIQSQWYIVVVERNPLGQCFKHRFVVQHLSKVNSEQALWWSLRLSHWTCSFLLHNPMIRKHLLLDRRAITGCNTGTFQKQVIHNRLKGHVRWHVSISL